MNGIKCCLCGYAFNAELGETPYTSTGILELCESCDDDHGGWIRTLTDERDEWKQVAGVLAKSIGKGNDCPPHKTCIRPKCAECWTEWAKQKEVEK